MLLLEGGNRMYETERKKVILEQLSQHKRVDLHGLSGLLKVSESTIRRDLKELEELNLLKRTHGGAIPIHKAIFEQSFEEKSITYSAEKKRIAKQAVKYINEGDVILLDSGSTMLYLAKELVQFSNLTVVTNAMPIAEELKNYNGIEVILIGGTLRKDVLSLVGLVAETVLGLLHVDKAFIATNGIHYNEGLSTPNSEEAAIKRKMIASAKQTILLADSSKIGEVTLFKFAQLSDIDVFITDSAISEDSVIDFQNKDLDIVIVDD